MPRSNVESKYRGLTNATTKVTWIELILHELRVCFPNPLLLFCDKN